MSRMLDLMNFLADHSGDKTHPAGCVAVTGDTDRPDGITWPLVVCQCPYAHPETNAGLSQQYADNGWVNIDGPPPCRLCGEEGGDCSYVCC